MMPELRDDATGMVMMRRLRNHVTATSLCEDYVMMHGYVTTLEVRNNGTGT